MQGHPSARATLPLSALVILLTFAALAVWTWLGIRIWPWREGQILVAAVCGGLAVAFLLSRGLPRWRRSIGVGALLALIVASAASPFSDYLLLQRKKLPPLWDYVDSAQPAMHAVVGYLKAGDFGGARAALLAHLKSKERKYTHIPRLWFPGWLDEANPDDANGILAGRFRFTNHPPAQLPENLSWSEDPYADRTWGLVLHSLKHVYTLLWAYRETGQERYLARAETLVLDWITDNSAWLRSPPSEFSWNDHAVAFRSVVLLEFLNAWIESPRSDPGKLEIVLRAIIGHAKDLADPNHYTERHNHGIDQDIALLAVATVLPELNRSAEWSRLAIRRLSQQLHATVSPAGVHLEHSPSYQVTTLGHLSEIHEFSREAGIAEFSSPEFSGLLERMAEFAAYTTKPDGAVALFGDSDPGNRVDANHRVLGRFLASQPVLAFAATRGARGQPGPTLKVYRDEGYAFIRRWFPGAFGQSIYLDFNAASNEGLAHKHADDLGFVLSACGRDLIVDHGFYGYNLDDYRKSVVSDTFHNRISWLPGMAVSSIGAMSVRS